MARTEIQSPEKCAPRWVNTHFNNFFRLWTKVHQLFSPNVGGVVVDQLLFRFSICGSFPEIFAIKVESCQKSRRILDVNVFFALPNLGGNQKVYHVISPGSRHVVWIKICDDIPISPELIDVYTLNFKPNFKFSRLKNLGDTRPSWGVR